MLKLNDTVWQQKLNLNDDCMLHWMLKEFLTWGAVEKVAEEYIINSGLSYEVSVMDGAVNKVAEEYIINSGLNNEVFGDVSLN